MKTNKIIIIILALAFGISFNSCVEDGDYTVPSDLGLVENSEVEAIIAQLNDPNGTLDEISIKNLKGLFTSGGDPVEITEDLVVKGYVTSSDRTGNFFKEIFIQDAAENPEAAIKVVLNLNDTYNKYNLGREVYIKLNGLFIGETRSGDGVITIGGVAAGDEIDDISIKQISENIFRSSVTQTLVPKTIQLSELTENHLGMFVQIENAQFLKDIKDLTFGDPDEQFDTQRGIESCADSGSISLETSSFSTFKFSPLPAGSFTINSVVSKTFDGSSLILVLNDKNDIILSGERCDPPELDCGTASTEGSTILFEEMFETQRTNSPISGNGWTNYQQAGTSGWEAYRSTGSNASQGISANVSPFRSGDAQTIAWLITPEIDLDTNTGVTLSFETSNSFSDASTLELLFSDNWDGTPEGVTTATWGVLPAAYITQDSDSFSSWFESGIVDLSCASGKIHFAFKYTGSGATSNDGTYELDNIKIAAN